MTNYLNSIASLHNMGEILHRRAALWLLVLLVILIIGCDNKVVCNKPYILVGNGCCLDTNDNLICDSDETTDKTVPEPKKVDLIKEDRPACPTSCDDANQCSKDYCSSETDYKCKHDSISSCCGNDICEKGELCNECSADCGKCLTLEEVEKLINIHYSSKERFEKNKFTVQHNWSGIENLTDYEFYDSQYAMIIKIINRSKVIKDEEDFKKFFNDYTYTQHQGIASEFNRTLIDWGNETDSIKYKIRYNTTPVYDIRYHDYNGQIIPEYSYHGIVYELRKGTYYTSKTPYRPYGWVMVYVKCSPEIILEIHPNTLSRLGGIWSNYNETKQQQEIADQMKIFREAALPDAEALLDLCDDS
jgi:hypothetical protein